MLCILMRNHVNNLFLYFVFLEMSSYTWYIIFLLVIYEIIYCCVCTFNDVKPTPMLKTLLFWKRISCCSHVLRVELLV